MWVDACHARACRRAREHADQFDAVPGSRPEPPRVHRGRSVISASSGSSAPAAGAVVHWNVSGGGWTPGVFQNAGLDQRPTRFWSVLKIELLASLRFRSRASPQIRALVSASTSHSRTGAMIFKCEASVWKVTSSGPGRSLAGAAVGDGGRFVLPRDADHELRNKGRRAPSPRIFPS